MSDPKPETLRAGAHTHVGRQRAPRPAEGLTRWALQDEYEPPVSL